MAWQLIYTSAPRLLEAGRSGFGTVARHRAIHPILAAALERDSQFDRSAVRGRVVFAHRIIAAGGSRFHVLSCIRETGADYTGRTNHIAHHLIIDPREVSLLGSAAPSPMDVCREMTWRTAWPDAPKWLEASEEISLAQFHPATTPGNDWQAITGDARYAGVLRPTTSSAVILPPEADALALFAESGTAAASQSWQATFTTCIQPTDDLSEFRWVAVEVASPVRERAIGGRTVLDLTAPETLPAPPESRSKLFIPTPDAVLPTPSSLAEKSKAKPAGNLFDDQLAVHTPRAQKRERRKSGLLPYIIALVVFGGAAIYCGIILFAESPELTAQRTKVREDVNAAFPGTGMETALTLSQVSKEQLPAALAIARTARETHEALQKLPLPEINVEEARGKAKAVSLNIPQPIGRIFDLYSNHFEFQKGLEKLRNSAPQASQLGELASLWSAADQYTDPQAKHLREPAMKSVESLWPERLRDVLKTDAQPKENADWFNKQFVSLPGALAESQPAKAAKKLIDDWRAVDAAGDDEKKLQALIADGRTAWPAWLIRKVEKRVGNKTNQLGIPGIQQTDTLKPENGTATSVSKPFEGGLIIVTKPTDPAEWADFAKELASGNCAITLGENSKPLSEQKGKFRKSANEADAAFTTDANGFRSDKAAPTAPYQLRLVRAEKTVLTAWVLQKEQPFHKMEGGIVRKDNEIHIQDVFSRSLCKLAKERGWDLTLLSPKWASVEIAGDGKASIAAKVSELKEAINKEESHLKYLKDIRDGNASPPNLENAIKDMGKYAGESFKQPLGKKKIDEIKDANKRNDEEKKREDYENAVPPKPQNQLSMGQFFKLASDGHPQIDRLFQLGDSLVKKQKDIAVVLPEALKVIEEERKNIDKNTPKERGDSPKKIAENEAARKRSETELARIERLKNFLEKIQTLPAARKRAEEEIPGIEANIQKAKGDDLLKPNFLPPGKYTISVQHSPTEQPIPFINFTISKPQ